MPISLLTIGQTDRAESRPLAEWLAASLQPADTRHFRDLTAALEETSRTNWIPDLIVVVQSWPDEFSPSEIASLFAFAPLARVVVAYGAWCESDGRNRHLWPLAVRVSLSSAAARIEREWRLLNEQSGLEPLPLSASREEAFAADHPPLAKTSSPQSVLVVSPDPAYRRYLHELLASAGHTVCRYDVPIPVDASIPLVTPTAILFDGDPWDKAVATRLRSFQRQHPATNIITLMNQPHANQEATDFISDTGTVLPKLGDQSSILNAIEKTAELIAAIPASRPA